MPVSRVQQALQSIPTFPPVPVKLIEQYLLTGDRKLLSQIESSEQGPLSWDGKALAAAVAPLADWTDLDRRAVHVLFAMRKLDSLGHWLNDALKHEKPDADVLDAVLAELKTCGATTRDLNPIFIGVTAFACDGKPTSAGRYVLGLSDSDLRNAVQQDFASSAFGLAIARRMGALLNLDMLGFLLDVAPDRIAPLLDLVGKSGNKSDAVGLLRRKGGTRFGKEIEAIVRSTMDDWQRFLLIRESFEVDPAPHREAVLEAARASLAGPANRNNHNTIGEWMVATFGKEAIPDLANHFEIPQEHVHFKKEIVAAVVRALKSESLPVLRAALKTFDPDLASFTLPHLIAIGDDSQDELIAQTLKRGFQDKKTAVQFVALAAQWKVSLIAEALWGVLTNKSKPARDAAARVLGRQGDAAIPRAGSLLLDKKADARAAAVSVLATVNSEKALALLEQRADLEPDEDVRDAILLGLAPAWAASGRKVTRQEIEARIARVTDKLKAPLAAWIDEATLPPLKFTDGEPLGLEAVRYLLYRQSRAKEIRPDVEAKPLCEMLERSSSGAFAIELLRQFLASKVDAGDRWALSLAALMGDDRIVAIMNQQIRRWADSSRGKMAEYAVEALSLLGTDAALRTIDALAIRYKAKNKNVGRAAVDAFAAAAANLGITPDELGDRVVPWLGFEPGQKQLIDCDGKKVEARITSDLKLQFFDIEKNKKLASLPKTASKEAVAEFKEHGATLKEVAKAQVVRLENLMVRQQRWPIERWTELFTMHPILSPMAVRLIWGLYDGAGRLEAAFRPLEDRSLTQATDQPLKLPAHGTIGIVHPLELTEQERKAWQTHLADYEITPPYPQLERPAVHLTPDLADKKFLTEYAGSTVNGMTFKGRADRLGWTRGSVCDGAAITTYFKSFPAAQVDVFLGLEGMYVGIDMSSEIKLQNAFFVRSGTVKTGSYTYDEPRDDSDDRLLRFGDVPPIVYSEVLGDLPTFAGKIQAVEEADG
jgi:Domain of unknown function (DUF4132)/HEAT repeats